MQSQQIKISVREAGADSEVLVSVAGEPLKPVLAYLKNHAVMSFIFKWANKVKAEMFRICNQFSEDNHPPFLIPEEMFDAFDRQCFLFTILENVLELSDTVQEGVQCSICLQDSTENTYLFLNGYRTCGTDSAHAICNGCMSTLLEEKTQCQTIAGGQFQWNKCIYCRSPGKYFQV